MFSLPVHLAHPRYAAALGAVAVLATAGSAAAQDRLPPNNGGLTQYVAPRPEPGGDKPANPNEPARRDSLPPSTQAALPPGAEGELLARVATSPGYGAPAGDSGGSGSSAGDGSDGGAGSSGGDGGGSGGGSAAERLSEEDGSAVSAVADAASDSGSLGLVAALVALTLGAVAIGRARSKRT